MKAASWMPERWSGIRCGLAVGLLTATSAACTVFLVTDGRRVLAGDSEDWIDPHTQVWFVPATQTTLGVMYFGFGEGVYPEGQARAPRRELPAGGIMAVEPSAVYGFPQAGVNERGLFFGGAATDAVPQVNPSGKPLYDGFLMDHIMRHCATVSEALAVFDRYCIGLPQGQLLLGDRTGDSAIIEAGDVVIRRQGRFQVITNFRQSQIKDGKITCPRFRKAQELLGGAETASIELARETLKAVGLKPVEDSLAKRRPGTQYSLVFELTEGDVVLYHQFDFERSTRLNVREELAKGPRALRIADLFKPVPNPP